MEPVWITEREVVDLLDLPAAIDALNTGLRMQHEGGARTMAKTHVSWGEGDTLHAIGAAFEGAGLVGTKSWAHTAGGAMPLLLIWNSESGAIEAIIEAFALGQMRTGGISGLATRHMAEPSASTLALIGAGKQALSQAAAVMAVRPISEVRVFSRTREKSERLVMELSALFAQVDIRAAASIEEASRDAQIVTLVTRAREPILESAMVAHGTHINAVGAITPEREELSQDIFQRATFVSADDPLTARRLAREFIRHFESNDGWDRVVPLCDVISGVARPQGGGDLSIFKAMGMGVSDMALGVEVLRRARAQGIGRPIPVPVRAKPRLVPHPVIEKVN